MWKRQIDVRYNSKIGVSILPKPPLILDVMTGKAIAFTLVIYRKGKRNDPIHLLFLTTSLALSTPKRLAYPEESTSTKAIKRGQG